jgi:hypothetical protein
MIPLDRDRLAKILAMLASPHSGEVVSAAKAASALIQAAGMTWNDVLETKTKHDSLQAQITALQASNFKMRAANHALRTKTRHQLYRQLKRLAAVPFWIILIIITVLLAFVLSEL